MSLTKITSKFKGTCRGCKKAVGVGEQVFWNRETKKVTHLRCHKIKNPKYPQKIDVLPPAYWKQKPFQGSYKNGRAK